MRKYLYLIKKKKIKSWLKFWLLTNNKFNIILSNIIEGTSFNLQNTVKRYFKIFNIFGNSVQNGTPTPTNPVPIESVADDVNLLNEETLTHGQLMSNNVINSSQTKMGYSDFINVSNFTNITISLKNSNLGYALERIFYYDSSKNEISSESPGNPKTFTPPNNTVYVRISITTTNWSSSVTFDEVKDDLNIKLQKGTVVTPYSPYNYGTFTIDFEGQTENYNYTFITKPLRSLPNGVKDTIEAEQHRKIRTYIFDGTEYCVKYINSTYAFAVYLPVGVPDIKHLASVDRVLCSHLQHTTLDNIYSKSETQGNNLISTQGTRTFAIMINNYTSTTELQTYLAQQYANGTPITVQYELAEETVEPYTEEQQEQYNKIKELYTFDGTTNIYSTDVVPPYLQIQYYMKGE